MSGDRPNELVERAYQVGAFAVAAPAAAVDRRGTIRALGIIQIVLGGIAGFVPMGMVAVMAIGTKRMGLFAGLGYLVPAVNLLVTGIGSVKIARWARRATLISAGIWLGFMLLAIVSMLYLGGFGMGRGEAALVTVIVVPVLLVVLALPIVLLVVYTRPSVRATFERRTG